MPNRHKIQNRVALIEALGSVDSRRGERGVRLGLAAVATIVLILAAWPHPCRALDLAEAVRLALAADAQLQADTATAEALAADGWRAIGGYGPNLTATGAIRRSRDESQPDDEAGLDDRLATFTEPEFILGLEQPLLDLEKGAVALRGRRDIARAKVQKKKAREELLLKVHERYFTALSSRENLRLAQSETAALHTQLDNAKSKLELGFITITDQHNAQARHSQSQAETIDRRTDYRTALVSLGELLDRPIGTDEELADLAADETAPVPAHDLEFWRGRAGACNSDLALSLLLAEAAQLDYRAAQARFAPALVFFADYNERRPDGGLLDYGETRSEADIGLRLRVDLLAGGRDTAGAIAAARRWRAARHQVEAARRRVEGQVTTLWNSITGTRTLIDAYAEATEAARLAMESTQAAYDEGVSDLLDALNAQQDYYRAVSRSQTSRYRYRILLEQFRLAVGTRDILSTALPAETTGPVSDRTSKPSSTATNNPEPPSNGRDHTENERRFTSVASFQSYTPHAKGGGCIPLKWRQ